MDSTSTTKAKKPRASTSTKGRARGKSPSPFRSTADTDSQDFMQEFWNHTLKVAENHEDDFKHQALPLARIKKVAKMDPDVQASAAMISSEVTVLFEKACQIFIQELTARAHLVSIESKRRTISRTDVAQAVSKSDTFDFLIDIVPREERAAANAAASATGTAAVASTSGSGPVPPPPPPPAAAASGSVSTYAAAGTGSNETGKRPVRNRRSSHKALAATSDPVFATSSNDFEDPVFQPFQQHEHDEDEDQVDGEEPSHHDLDDREEEQEELWAAKRTRLDDDRDEEGLVQDSHRSVENGAFEGWDELELGTM
ncbi:uncharacterized protein JCM15063_002927 [Sporobolomyces koalae]|uniref:uncharacterized protein n=1 Tax=Sporobolomyces koalae TaxID=500713 RepID=UPI003176400B